MKNLFKANNMKNLAKIGIISLVIALLGSCAFTKTAILMDSSFNTASSKQIFLYPPIDSRIDKKIDINLDNHLQKAAYKDLTKKGYKVVLVANAETTTQIIDEDLKTPDPNWIGHLKPDDAHIIMVIELVDLQTKLTFGSTGNAEISGYIFDKDSKKMIWHDKGIGQVGQGGLIGMAEKGMMASNAINAAMFSLLSSIPKRPK